MVQEPIRRHPVENRGTLLNRETVNLITLLTLLREKGLVSDEEIRTVQTVGRILPILVERGVLTEEQFLTRSGEITEIVEISRKILARKPITRADGEKLEHCRKVLPKLAGLLLEGVSVPKIAAD